MLETKISRYNGVTDNIGKPTTVKQAFDAIVGDKAIAETVALIRQATQQHTRDILKKKLPGVTWSGIFEPTRQDKNFAAPSGLLCLDIDKLTPEQLPTVQQAICAQQYTYACFVSPSGNGLKVLVQVPALKALHRQLFAELKAYYEKATRVEVDASGVNESRLCFLSHDPNMYLAEHSTIYELVQPTATEETDLAQNDYETLQGTDANLDDIKKFTDNLRTYAPYSGGNTGRNEYVYLFARNCNRKGIDINDCLNYVTSYFAGDLVAEDGLASVAATVRSGYRRADEHGKFARKKNAGRNHTTKNGNLPQRNIQFGTEPENEYTQFWFEDEIEVKGKTKTVIEVGYRLLIQFLAEHGFHRLQIGDNGYELVHYSNNIVKRVQAYQVRDFVINWAVNKELWAVEEKLRRGSKTYLSNDQLNSLPFIEVEFQKDTPTEAFFYFSNCWVCCTAQGITTHQYSTLQKAIWDTQINKREFHKIDNWLLDFENPENIICVYARFVYYTCHNPKGDEPADLQTVMGRYDSFCTAFGYLLHSYKNPSIAKMILAVDHKIGEKGEQNGGSGKSLAGKALSELKYTTNISGKDFKEDYAFKYEQITPDSQIVCFNDFRRNFNLECLFENITGDWIVNRRNIGYLVLPFETSPKTYGSTNFIMSGEGSSFLRRMHIIEFSDYFNEEYTPFDEFGHTLFQDWDAAEFNRFDNFMLQNCCSLWLKKGLIKYPGSNYDVRKLQSEVPEEFIDFLDQTTTSGEYIIKRNVCHRKIDMLEKFREYTKGSGLKDPTAHSFTKWMKKYCKTNGYEWNKHTGGKRDSSGPLGEFVSICDASYNHDNCINSRGALFHKN